MNYTTNVGEAGLAVEQTERLISSEKVEGTAVFDSTGAHLGRVHHLMIDKHTGQVAFAVATFGGFFGIGENLFPLPWKVLNYDTRRGGYVVDVNRAKLAGAPSYSSAVAPDWSDRAYEEEITKYWLPPV
jgi:sporulation protein YlmC with PRC-barrel domain